MDIDLLKRVILDQKKEKQIQFQREKIIVRDLMDFNLIRFLQEPNILVISGIRRAGKSTLASMILQHVSHLAINFDDDRLAGFQIDDFDRLLIASQQLIGDTDYILLDEIQNIPNWELFAARLRRTKKIIITGSNARLLSGELATHLTGRYVEMQVFPYSFREFLQMRDINWKEKEKQNDLFYSTEGVLRITLLIEEFLNNGGFPEFYLFGRDILQRIYEDILEKDIINRKNIKKKQIFKDLVRYLIQNNGHLVTYAGLKKLFPIADVHTVANYLGYLQEAYLIIVVEKYSPKLRSQVLSPKKIFFVDTGLVTQLTVQINPYETRLMENLVAIELVRRKLRSNSRWDIFYWSDYKNHEIDFVKVMNNKILELIQVSWIKDGGIVPNREWENLITASEDLKCNNLLLITWSWEEMKQINGRLIRFIPLWKWLLIEDSEFNPTKLPGE